MQAAVDRAVVQFGGLDVMFNNAGIPSSFTRILENDLADFQQVMGVNLFGVMLGTQRAARHMAEHGGGSIINTASIAALSGGAGPIVYRVSKAAVVQFSRSMAIDLAPYNIRVVGLVPGLIAPDQAPQEALARTDTTVPLQRAGTSEDLAGPAVFLASDDAAYVTGSFVTVDGGVLFQQRSPEIETFPVSNFPTV